MRKPNELWISCELLEEMYRAGFEGQHYRVRQGPGAAARIIGVHMEPAFHCVALEYDRPVDEVLLVSETFVAA